MQQTRCQIRFPNHCAHVVVDHKHIHVFKYTDRTCDFMVFTIEEQEQASDYILETMPTVFYHVTVHNDRD